MKNIGIIAEYNPFHEGHAHLLKETRAKMEGDLIVSVMSGNFTQRGEPAIASKWERARSACEQGVNLVVELPTVYACNSAELFAKGGVSILEGFGLLDGLCFGSESGDIRSFSEAASYWEQNETEILSRIKALQKEGYSFPKARSMAFQEMDAGFDGALFSEPNNILGFEYLRQIQSLTPMTIPRQGLGYHASGTKLREAWEQEHPQEAKAWEERYVSFVIAEILKRSPEELEQIFLVDQGLSHKLKNSIRYGKSLEDLLVALKSKVYTRTRLQRLLTQILLGITQEVVWNAKPYIRVLALDESGAAFLKRCKKQETLQIPVITNINREAARYPEILPTLAIDILAGDLYNLITNQDLYRESDYVKRPYIRK